MVRIKRGNVAAKRRKKYLKLAKGYRGSNSRLSTFAAEQIVQSLNFSYIGRKLRKRNFRSIWVARIGAAAKIFCRTYSNFIGNMRKSRVLINRKALAEIACSDLRSFEAIGKFAEQV